MFLGWVYIADKSLYDLYGKGSRRWLLEIVISWLNNTDSKERAFLLSGVAGLGKSVVASQVFCVIVIIYIVCSLVNTLHTFI